MKGEHIYGLRNLAANFVLKLCQSQAARFAQENVSKGVYVNGDGKHALRNGKFGRKG